MKHLKIEYNGRVLFDGEVVGMDWSEGTDQVTVTGRLTEKPGIKDLINAATAQKRNGNHG